MPLPIAHALLGATIVAASLPEASPARSWKLMLAGAALSVSPDLDYFLRTSSHRSFTHSLLLAAVVGALCLAVWGRTRFRAAMGCAGAIFSHGLLDFATTKTMPGVELLWPISHRRFGLGLVDYYQLTGVDPTFFLDRDVLRDLMRMGAIELLIFAPLLLLVLAVKWAIKSSSRS